MKNMWTSRKNICGHIRSRRETLNKIDGHLEKRRYVDRKLRGCFPSPPNLCCGFYFVSLSVASLCVLRERGRSFVLRVPTFMVVHPWLSRDHNFHQTRDHYVSPPLCMVKTLPTLEAHLDKLNGNVVAWHGRFPDCLQTIWRHVSNRKPLKCNHNANIVENMPKTIRFNFDSPRPFCRDGRSGHIRIVPLRHQIYINHRNYHKSTYSPFPRCLSLVSFQFCSYVLSFLSVNSLSG